MSLDDSVNRLIRLLARMNPRLRRYADNGLPKRIVRAVERRVNADEVMENIMERRFIFESRTVPGQRWLALTPRYRTWKARRGYSTKILTRTGAMRDAAVEAVKGTWRFGESPRWNIGMVKGIEYAPFANQRRPFVMNPTAAELKPAEKRALRYAKEELMQIAKGN